MRVLELAQGLVGAHRRRGRVSPGRCRRGHDGFALIEVMVTIVLLSIGLLGLAALQTRTAIAQMESYQRTQALILAQDMADRIAANSMNAARYAGDAYGTGPALSCSGLNGFEFDRCAWDNAIRGTSERAGGITNVGTLLGGRGCIAVGATGRIQVIVAWQGQLPTVAPIVACGQDDYGDEAYRRAVVVPLRIARLAGT